MAFAGYVKIEGIDGESTDDKHPKWIEILSYNHSISQAAGASTSRTGGMTGARPDIGDFTFVKVLDLATPNLAKYCMSGKHIPTVEVELCAADEAAHPYMKYKLSDVVVSSIRKGGASNDEGTRPVEEVGIRFAKIEYEYTPFDNKGKAGAAVKSGYDLATNKAL